MEVLKKNVPPCIREPRKYQLNLLEYVSRRNAIIYLPTGAGKTYVAILAIKRYSHQMQETISKGGKRAIFMCNTIELARQQATELKKCTNLKIGFYVGERNVDNWSRKKWNEEIDENQVLVGTAQIFLDIVTQNYLKISDLSIVVMDECHHATKNHPMHEFMRIFQYCDQSELPRVIGLTGVLLKGNKLGNIKQDLANLEATFRSKIVTVRTMEELQNVMVFSTKPIELFITYSSNRHFFDLETRISRIIDEMLEIVDKWNIGSIPKLTKGLAMVREPNKKNFIKNLLKDFVYQMTDFGLYAASYAIMSVIVEFELKKRSAETIALRNLYRAVITQSERIRRIIVNKLKDTADDDDDDDDNDGDNAEGDANNANNVNYHNLETIYNFSSPKVESLLRNMKSQFQNKTYSEICCLIFVDRRYSAKCLYFVIQSFVKATPELRDIIKPQFMVGRNTILPSIESILENKWNASAVESFRSGLCNVIICSSVLEEGIDLQACNYVFAFDPLKTFNFYIQTKGRARSSESIYAIFAPKVDETKVVSQIRKYKEVHELIKSFLVGRILEDDDPTEEDVSKQFTDMILPYRTPSGAVLLASSAMMLVHRYCQALPSDSFGLVAPWFTKLDTVSRCQVSLKMPLQSTVKETIISDLMDTTKEAKMSAAFKACIKLYENGELNSKLLPITRRECVEQVSDDLFEHWKKFRDDPALKRTGKQKRRLYERMCPEELYNAMPIVGETCFAYEIKIRPLFAQNDYNEHIIRLLKLGTNYAILLRNRLPRLAEMPLFMNQGKLSVQIAAEPVQCCIKSNEQLEKLLKYHVMVFRDVLRSWKSFFVVDKRNKQNSMLLVPINSQRRCIDWDLVENFQCLVPQRKYSVAERAAKVIRPEDFEGKVVSKWYSESSTSNLYIVTKVRTDLTPQSPFDNSTYKSYAHYMECKYRDIVECVVQPQQFMLEVKAVPERRNFYNNSMGKDKLINRNRQSIMLIPEMCHNFQYPGDMLLKAILLPSILARLHFMLHAETLRCRINSYLGVAECRQSYRPKPLIIDTSLRRAVDIDGNVVEDVEEHKKMLASLTDTQAEPNIVESSAITNNVGWKDYIEPDDYTRKSLSLYPVELSYYYNFVSGLVADMQALKIEQEEEWTKSQLKMPSPSKKKAAPQVPMYDGLKPAITNAPLEDRRHLEILERSLGSMPITSAEQYEFLAALTTAGASDVFDMERFELLGDSFLKLSISLYLVNRYPTWHEGFFTIVKSKFVSNRNLLYCMHELDIPQRICATLFKPSHQGCWLPLLCSVPNNLLEHFESASLPMLNTLTTELFSMELSEREVWSGKCSDEHLTRSLNACGSRDMPNNDESMEAHADNYLNGLFYKQAMPDKVVSDTLEALLGVCVKNYGVYHGFRMLEFFGICKPSPGQSLTKLMDLNLHDTRLLRTNISSREVDVFLVNHHKLEENLGYTFRDRSYLLQALTHPTYPTNRITGCYQVLEFIGDAILDFLVSSYIFERHVEMTPGKLTDLRSALVNNITLGCVCVRHRFHLFLLAENSILAESIKNFASFQETQDHRVTEQLRILMEEDVFFDESNGKTTCYNLSVNVDVPKVLGDMVEALIAAVYLDSRDLRTTWNVIYRLLEQEFNDFSQCVPIDAVRRLYEHKHADPKFSKAVVEDEVVMVNCEFTCLNRKMQVNGFGSNSTQAKKSAAKHALQILSKCSN